MRKMFTRLAVVGVVAAVGVSTLPQVALAAGSSNTCSFRTCSTTGRNFPGGTISIDADAGGTLGGSDTGHWGLSDAGSPIRCQADFPVTGGLRSWTCTGVRAGTVTATVVGPAPLKIGVRW
ncbi:hypothetical protein KOI35_30970 [Actinoplanes bogorensis]|uniref:Uncharacterized protein n=1 Tax=Paractinoplanes bogorensis TaxID=1610840 RepID=A0ABS5YX35_9ACTN|nr:hypothetical protein [Actinoplanes bogorensis]MBU2667943.1 hypothetical protein [Actinoplanes bogorensis]